MKYTTVQEQIQILRMQNLRIDNEDDAAAALSNYGYSNIIKAYRDPYIITDGEEIHYREGVRFDQILSLYLLDKHLRSSVMAAMLDFEELMKAAAADVLAEHFGTTPEDYLCFQNFKNKRKKKPQFSLPTLLNNLRKNLSSGRDPIRYYREKKGVVPPWILFQNAYFSTVVNLIDHFKPTEQVAMVERLYHRELYEGKMADTRLLMLDTLFIAMEYRNLAAHGGRIYNHTIHHKLRISSPASQVDVKLGFSMLTSLLRFMLYDGPYQTLSNTLTAELNRHCQMYPYDATFLATTMNIDIEQHSYVYVSPKSHIYHADPYCSGMHNARQLELEEAISTGYRPCKRCAIYRQNREKSPHSNK